MVSEFLGWWLSQLADLLPEQLCRFGSRDVDAVVISPVAPLSESVDGVLVSLRRNGQETTLGRFELARGELADIPRLAGRPAVLRLVADDVLGKTLVLPLAVERQLDQALAFEMDRETPFLAEEVFWTYRVARRDRR